MTTEDFANRHPDLILEIRSWELGQAASLCAGLLLCPSMHAHTFSLEILLHAICVYAVGHSTVTPAHLAAILEVLQPAVAEEGELPRDVFVVNVVTSRGNRRFLSGT